MNRCLLSHAHADSEIAKEIAKILERVSLQGITVWHSSDEDGGGGIGAGERWLDSIRENLNKSRSVIALLTPNSIDRPWIYFESGFGAASAELEVIPIAVGLNSLSSIPMPLAMYQSYLINDKNSLEKFLEKVLSKFEVKFDSEMAASPIRECINNITGINSVEPPVDISESSAGAPSNSKILQHIDKRFFELIVKLDPHDEVSTYSVPVHIDFPIIKSIQHLEIDASLNLQDALNACWSFVSDEVRAYTYLEDWILEEIDSGKKLVVREIQHLIPARNVFRPGIGWRAYKLETPYEPVESNIKSRDWRNNSQ